MLIFSEPEIIERPPYLVVGTYCTFEGENEGPGWVGASSTFFERQHEITNRADDQVLGFLYRPHRDHPEISPDICSCFVGAEVTDLDHVPDGMVTTHFPGGQYVIVACQGSTEAEAAEGVGQAIGMLTTWMPAHGYVEGGACFACSPPRTSTPPYVEYVYIHMERAEP